MAVASRWRGTGPGPSSQRRAYPGKHDGAGHATTVSRCGRGRARFWRSGKTPRRPAAPPAPAGFPDVRAGGTPCGKKAGSPSATVRRPGRPRVQVPAIPGSANSIQAQSYSLPPFVPSPADRRRHASSGRFPAVRAAVPATASGLPHGANRWSAPAPGTHPFPACLGFFPWMQHHRGGPRRPGETEHPPRWPARPSKARWPAWWRTRCRPAHAHRPGAYQLITLITCPVSSQTAWHANRTSTFPGRYGRMVQGGLR